MTKILLVEDDKSLREIYGTRLLAENFDIVSAGDGEEALALAIKEKPDLIISDVMMPKISGFDMLDILRSTTETRDIKVIMMTALSSDDQRARGEQLGADKYLVKSQVGIEDVVQAVHQVLGDGGTTAPAVLATSAPASPTDATAPSVPASDTTTPDTATVSAAPTETVVTLDGTSTPVSAPVTTDTPVSGSAPGNDAAGPLPPQPSEMPQVASSSESSLPQPTAPFSSPRPTNLGENVVHPETTSDNTTPSTSDSTSVNLSSPVAEPVSTTTSTVDATVAPVSDSAAPALTTSGLDFEATTPNIGAAPTIEPVAPSTTPDISPSPDLSAPSEEKKDSTTPPPAAPSTPAV